MVQRTSKERLARAAYWHYVQNLTQAEVAAKLGTSRSNVSRMLTAAREEGIIRFEVVYPTRRDLGRERALADLGRPFGLREAIVTATTSTAEDGSPEVGTLATAGVVAEWLDDNLRDGQTLGMFWGSTVRAFVDLATFTRQHDVNVVQLGGEWSNDPRRSGHDLVRDLGLKIGGRYTYFNAPAYTSTPQQAEALLTGQSLAESMDVARAADVCVLGVGSFNEGTTATFLDQAQATPTEIEQARSKRAVGQIAGRFFDDEGRQLDLDLHKRLVSLDLTEVRTAESILAVATGESKRDAVQAAVRGGLIDVLVADDHLADALITAPWPSRS